MKITSENSISDQQLEKIIIKNLKAKKKFFQKHLHYDRNKICKICENQNLKKIAKQFRNYQFYDHDTNSDNPRKYYNDVKYCLDNENLLFCNKCGLIFSEITYPYEFYLDMLTNLDDQSDPLYYDKNLLEIDREWALDKHKARINFLNNYDHIYGKNCKFLEISSYRGWGLDYSKDDMDVFGIEAHEKSANFSKIKFPHLSKKINYNLFELSEEFINKNKKFDIILISQAFRHMKDPFKSLEILEKILNNGGYVIVDESLFLDTIITEYLSGLKDENYLSTIFTHGKAFYFSKEHVKYIFESNGFDFIKYEKYESKKIDYIEEDLLLFKKNERREKKKFIDYHFDSSFKFFSSIQENYKEDISLFKKFYINKNIQYYFEKLFS